MENMTKAEKVLAAANWVVKVLMVLLIIKVSYLFYLKTDSVSTAVLCGIIITAFWQGMMLIVRRWR